MNNNDNNTRLQWRAWSYKEGKVERRELLRREEDNVVATGWRRWWRQNATMVLEEEQRHGDNRDDNRETQPKININRIVARIIKTALKKKNIFTPVMRKRAINDEKRSIALVLRGRMKMLSEERKGRRLVLREIQRVGKAERGKKQREWPKSRLMNTDSEGVHGWTE